MAEVDRVGSPEWLMQVAADQLAKNTDIQYHEQRQELSCRRPNSGLYAIEYLIRKNTLIVTGDVGCAIYQWCDSITFDFVAGCHLHYFEEKCVASEAGRDFIEWDPRVAQYRLTRLKDSDELCSSLASEILQSGAFNEVESVNEFVHSVNGDADLSGEELAMLCNIGYRVHLRCAMHLHGVQRCRNLGAFST